MSSWVSSTCIHQPVPLTSTSCCSLEVSLYVTPRWCQNNTLNSSPLVKGPIPSQWPWGPDHTTGEVFRGEELLLLYATGYPLFHVINLLILTNKIKFTPYFRLDTWIYLGERGRQGTRRIFIVTCVLLLGRKNKLQGGSSPWSVLSGGDDR